MPRLGQYSPAVDTADLSLEKRVRLAGTNSCHSGRPEREAKIQAQMAKAMVVILPCVVCETPLARDIELVPRTTALTTGSSDRAPCRAASCGDASGHGKSLAPPTGGYCDRCWGGGHLQTM